MRTLAAAFIVLLLATLASPEARAHPVAAEYSITIGNTGVSFIVKLNILQNLTIVKDSFTLPTFHRLLDETNSSAVATDLQNILQAKSPKAQVSALTLEATSTPWSNQTRIQWFNISLAFNVVGISTSSGGVAQYDLSWKSFAVASNLVLDGFEVNNIGSGYLLGVVQEIGSEAPTTSPLIRTTFHVNGRAVAGASLVEAVQKVSSLNFSSLAPQISNWQRTEDPFSKEVSWSLDPSRSFGMDVALSITEERGPPTTTVYGVLYHIEGEITAPRRSTAKGDLVTVVLDETPETLMGVTILSSASIGLVALLYERRVTGRRVGKPKRERR